MMSKGILLFAHNTSRYNYVKIADVAAKLANKNLELPVSIITSTPELVQFSYDKIIVQQLSNTQNREFEPGQVSEWHNTTRHTAYALSPYEQTLLIDCDYFLYTDNLKKIFDTATDFACYHTSYDLTGKQNKKINYLGYSDSPMFWATAIYFRKTKFANMVFDFVEHVKLHWEYYSYLYNFDRGTFRNDFALTIAMQTLTGQQSLPKQNRLPGELVNVPNFINIKDIRKNGEFVLSWNDSVVENIIRIKDMDLHLMNKDILLKNVEVLDAA